MTYIPLDELLKNVGSVFKLTVLSARRASEINGGMPKLVNTSSKKPMIIALEEIAQGKVNYKVIKGKK
ncbi:MAG: DNA-directed RNA polymerase subunit omega [Candidatus Omnitrophota bacterium]|nr:DNA-directed RNA polymerase subunit omega [Candidatus Omnitrophota bacterium]